MEWGVGTAMFLDLLAIALGMASMRPGWTLP
jgi:hypothetical protein